MSSQQPTTKRIKLAGAFSTVPTPRVEVPPIASTAVTATKTAVYTMPPAIAKYDSGIPVALLKARDAQGPIVTISQPKKPAFTFGSPIIGDKPVGGFAYMGYELVKGGDSAPLTGSFAYAADARSAYALKSGKLYSDRNKLSSATTDTTIDVPMSALGGTWGETKIPTITLASNTNALFKMPSFVEAQDEAATKIDLGAGDAVLLIAADKRLETETAIVTSPLPYLPHLNKYVMLLNPPIGCKYGATVIDAMEPASRPLKLTLQHAAKESRTVVVEVWPSTLAEAGLDAGALRTTPVIAYINASLDAWSGETKLMVVALATPPPDVETKHVAFAKSPALKSHFNDLGHTAEEAKTRERSVDQLLMNEGRAVPLAYARAGVANTLLLDKSAAVGVVKSHAVAMAREQSNESTKGVLAVVNAATDETIANGLGAIDKIPGYATIESLMAKINSQMDDAGDDVQQAEMVSAATFLHALLAGGKATVDALRPLVYGYKLAGDAAEDDESDFEGGEDDDDDLSGNL